MTDYTELKRLAEAVKQSYADLCEHGGDQLAEAWDSAELAYDDAANPVVVLALIAENERLSGIQPSFPLRPPEGEGLPRYGLRWNGPQQPLATPMDDGYWTPWHLADQLKAENEALRKDAERYQWLRDNSESVHAFYLSVPVWFSGIRFRKEDVDRTIDAAIGTGEQ